MPFKEETVEQKRETFVAEAMAHQKSFAALCREYSISRPTGYLWLARAQSGEGYSDKSRRPFKTANKTASDMEDQIIAARRKEPAIGAVKIKRMLANQGVHDVPSQSTINAILRRNNLITQEASLAATPYRRFEKEAPNMLWQCDFKGNYGLVDGTRCHPLSVIDDHSRFCLCADAKVNERLPGVVDSFTHCFLTYGLPETLLCDNGNPWGANQSGGTTRFEVWLMELGILTMHIRPYRPQTQGKVERFNGSYKQERLRFYTPRDFADAARQRLEYREFYNHERPHHALRLDTPTQHYAPSEREYTKVLRAWDYDDCETRKIKRSGYLTYGGGGYYLSEAFGEKSVGLRPSAVDGVMDVVFRQFRVAQLDLREKALISRRIYRLKDDPRTLNV